jgi:hypothetical protein
MSLISTIAFPGKSGQIYHFDVWSMDHEFLQKSGLYVLSKRELNEDGDYAHIILFVGQTEDLSSISQVKQNSISVSGASCICVLVDAQEMSQDEIADDLINYHKPSFQDHKD